MNDTHGHEPDNSFARGIREFSMDGETWIARLTGGGAVGTGVSGLGMIEAIQFSQASAPERPVREALVQRGIFDWLQDAELRTLLQSAQAIPQRRTMEDRH